MKSKLICHVITGLESGGAEATLVKLVLHDTFHKHVIISLNGEGKYSEILRKNNLKVFHFKFKNIVLFFPEFIRLIFLFKKIKPEIVQTWMYHSDLIGGLAAKLAFIKIIIWNIRTSKLPLDYKISTQLVIKLCAYFSWILPNKIITCSKSNLSIHQEKGYCINKFKVIFNGFSNPKSKFIKKELFFRKLNLDHNNFNIICVGRYAPQKDHNNLLKALQFFRSKYSHLAELSLNLLLIGKNTSQIFKDNKWFNAKKLKINLSTINNTNNVYDYFHHMDISVLASAYGEAFPNVLAESMICGVPCIATDVGDSKYILGGTGWIVRPSAPEDFSKAIYDALNVLYI